MDLNVIFPMQSSEFKKSLNFESILNLKFFILQAKIDFYRCKKKKIWNTVLSDKTIKYIALRS